MPKAARRPPLRQVRRSARPASTLAVWARQMAEESLRELLARLHEQLGARGRALDAESRQLLTTVMRDIEHALDRADRATDKADHALDEVSAAAAAHSPRLESLAVRFEAGHPAIAEALRELIDALVKAGI